jgi:hypothetical protein
VFFARFVMHSILIARTVASVCMLLLLLAAATANTNSAAAVAKTVNGGYQSRCPLFALALLMALMHYCCLLASPTDVFEVYPCLSPKIPTLIAPGLQDPSFSML